MKIIGGNVEDEDYQQMMKQFENFYTSGGAEGDFEGDEGDAGFNMDNLASLFGGEGGNAAMLQEFMAQMMKDMMSKEYLYEPMKDLADRMPAYLAEHSADHTPEEIETYKKQLTCYEAIITAFDATPEDTETVTAKMGELQSYGPPPRALLPEEDREALEAMSGSGAGVSSEEAAALQNMGDGCAQQ